MARNVNCHFSLCSFIELLAVYRCCLLCHSFLLLCLLTVLEIPLEFHAITPFCSCRYHFRRRCLRSAGDNKILQVCFRLGVKKIRSASRISTGCVSRLVVRTGVLLRRIAGCCCRSSGGEQNLAFLDVGLYLGHFAVLLFLCIYYCLNPVVYFITLSVMNDSLVADT